MRAALLATSLFCLAAPALAQQASAPAAVPPIVEPRLAPPGKLSHEVTPIAYRLDLTVDPEKERFSGHVEIDTVAVSRASYFLHGRDLAITSATAKAGGKTFIGHWHQVDDTGVAELSFDEKLPVGPVTLAFDYDAAFENGPSGFFRVKVGDDYYSWTQFESIDGRAAFPSFDEPGFKTPFTVTLRTKPGQMAVSNAPETGKTLENGFEVHRFAPTLPLPTYLVAMMVGPFVTVESSVPPTPQRDYPLPLRIVSTKQNAGKLKFALDGTKGIIAHLEGYFGQPFPYPKLDQITTPILPGAMENAGADLYGDSIIVMGENASTSQKRQFGMVVSHELAHQWFGDLVTPAWWDDIWLNESFANWMGYRIGSEWRPDLNIAAGALNEGFTAMSTDALVAGRPIHQTITRNTQIDEAFDSITYGKGGHVVAMIAAFMGDTKFRDGVRRYMTSHKYGNASSTDFFAAMAQAAGDARIVPAMQSFTDQQGVPLLSFSRGAADSWMVTQSRYARLGTDAPATHWGVPMCLRRGAERQCSLLESPSTTVTIKGKGPLVPNAGGAGYYRFELPESDWDALIGQADKLPSGEALATADSLIASYRAGRASADQLAALARKLVHNRDSYASNNASSGLEMLAGSGMLDDPAIAAYHRFIARLYGPQMAKLGFDPRANAYAGEDPEKSQRRVQLIGKLTDASSDTPLHKQLGDAAKAWLAGDREALDPAWYASAFEVYLGDGGMVAAKALVERALASQDADFRPVALDAAATSGKEDIARWLLNDLNDSRLRPNEQRGLLRGVISTGKTRELGYGWMKSHLDDLFATGGIFFAARLPQMLNGFCSAQRADEFTRDLRPRFAGKTGAMELERSIERVRSCGVLKEARSKEASAAIAKLR